MRTVCVIVAVISFVGCESSSTTSLPPDTDPIYSVKRVQITDSSGIGSAACPTGYLLTGGGCFCGGVGDVLFASISEVATNEWLCACYDGAMDAIDDVHVVAHCVGTNTAGSLKVGLAGSSDLIPTLRASRAAYHKAP